MTARTSRLVCLLALLFVMGQVSAVQKQRKWTQLFEFSSADEPVVQVDNEQLSDQPTDAPSTSNDSPPVDPHQATTDVPDFANVTLASDQPLNLSVVSAAPAVDQDTVNALTKGLTDADVVVKPKCEQGCTIENLLQAPLPAAQTIANQVDIFEDSQAPPAPVIKRVYGRVRVYSLGDEDSSEQCLEEVMVVGRLVLGQSPCAYKNTQIFLYDQATGALSARGQEYGVWTQSDASFPKSFRDTFVDGQLPIVPMGNLSSTARKNLYVNWSISLESFNAIVVDNSIDDGKRFCLVGSNTADSRPMVAVRADSDLSMCSAFYFTPIEDDFVSGRIRLTSRLKGMERDDDWCLTYNPQSQDRASSTRLTLTKCATDRTSDRYANQRFLYNRLTYHLRTFFSGELDPAAPHKNDNLMLFFWWSGNIKSYDNFAESTPNYGWRVPLMRSGAITVKDDRGYSGGCMGVEVTDNGYEVRATQKCHTFAMELEKIAPFLSRNVFGLRRYLQARVSVRSTDQSQPVEYLEIVRRIRTFQGKSAGYMWMVRKSQKRGGAFTLTRHFLLSLPWDSDCAEDRSCTSTQGHIRWSGDPSNTMFAPRSRVFNTPRLIFPSPAQETKMDWDFALTINQWAPITTSDERLCLAFDDRGYLVIRPIDNISSCSLFNIEPIRKFANHNATLLQQFDSRSLFYVPSDPSLNKGYLQDLAKRALKTPSITGRELRFLNKYFDVFYTDMGEFGNRRYRAVGKGSFRSTSGFVSTNVNGEEGGVYLPFWPHSKLREQFTLIEVNFAANRQNISKFSGTDKNFLLLSFQSTHGCTVFISRAGLPGINCKANSELVNTCQARSITIDYKPLNLLDGAPHTVGFLFSRRRGGHVRIFVDGVESFSCYNRRDWKMGYSSNSLWLFHQPGRWQYQPLPAFLFRASVYTSNQVSKVEKVAAFAPNKKAVTVVVGDLETRVKDCKDVIDNDRFVGIRCNLYIMNGHRPIPLSLAHLSLACSRPGCQIGFTKRDAYPIGPIHQFLYQPGFPAEFVSENVGYPDPIVDVSFIADNFDVFKTQFTVGYAPQEDASLMEVDADVAVEADAENESGTMVSDANRYRCIGRCGVSGAPPLPLDTTDDIFP